MNKEEKIVNAGIRYIPENNKFGVFIFDKEIEKWTEVEMQENMLTWWETRVAEIRRDFERAKVLEEALKILQGAEVDEKE